MTDVNFGGLSERRRWEYDGDKETSHEMGWRRFLLI